MVVRLHLKCACKQNTHVHRSVNRSACAVYSWTILNFNVDQQCTYMRCMTRPCPMCSLFYYSTEADLDESQLDKNCICTCLRDVNHTIYIYSRIYACNLINSYIFCVILGFKKLCKHNCVLNLRTTRVEVYVS
jgi:hypothetical protein